MTYDLVSVAVMVGSAVLFVTAASVAFGWAWSHGEFQNTQQAAESIFAPDEPIGQLTDTALSPRASRDLSRESDGESGF
jgi:nitrogen fixation-related uncharacterized protein